MQPSPPSPLSLRERGKFKVPLPRGEGFRVRALWLMENWREKGYAG